MTCLALEPSRSLLWTLPYTATCFDSEAFNVVPTHAGAQAEGCQQGFLKVFWLTCAVHLTPMRGPPRESEQKVATPSNRRSRPATYMLTGSKPTRSSLATRSGPRLISTSEHHTKIKPISAPSCAQSWTCAMLNSEQKHAASVNFTIPALTSNLQQHICCDRLGHVCLENPHGRYARV